MATGDATAFLRSAHLAAQAPRRAAVARRGAGGDAPQPQWRRPSLAIGAGAAAAVRRRRSPWWHRGAARRCAAPRRGSRGGSRRRAGRAGGRAQTKRTLVLSGAGDLRAALIANGVDRGRGRRRRRRRRRARSTRSGEVRAVLTLEPADGGDSAGAARGVQPGQFGRGRHAARGRRLRRVARGGAAAARGSSCGAGGWMPTASIPRRSRPASSDSLIPEFAKALAFDFDFQREVKLGDVFEAAFEQAVERQRRAGRRAAPALCRAHHRDQIAARSIASRRRAASPTGSTPAAAASSAR